MEDSGPGFGKIRSLVWPIGKHELFKFVPMLFFFFLIAFNYYLLRQIKDVLVITAPKSGAEATSFIKLWLMLPCAMIATIFFTKLANRLNREKLFYIIIGSFLSFFFIFTLFIYPHQESLHPHTLANSLQTLLPSGFKGFIAIIRYWSFSLFYVMAELWSTMMISVLMWGFANEVIKVHEASRFYAFFSVATNISGIVVGYLCMQVASPNHSLYKLAGFFGNTQNHWDNSFYFLMTLALIVGVLAIGVYRFLHVHIFNDPNQKKPYSLMSSNNKIFNKTKISFSNSVQYILKSRYLLSIAVIVLSYNLIIHLTEVLWKAQVKEFFPSSNDFSAYTAKITLISGCVAALFSYFLSGNFIRRFGWRFTALLTPIIIAITGVFFFSFLFLKHNFVTDAIQTIGGISPLAFAVYFGALQNILARASKFTFFDDTKEMAFIPLKTTSKLRGKAAIDGVGSRLGKSGAAGFIQFMLLFFSSVTAFWGIICMLFFAIIPIWTIAVQTLGKKFTTKTAAKAIAKAQSKTQKPKEPTPVIADTISTADKS